MPRDYKHRAHRRHTRDKGLPPWLTLLGGLLIGLFVAFLVFIRMQAKPVAQVYVKETLPMPAHPQAPADSKAQGGKNGKPAATATDTDKPSVPKPRFDFYTRLPEMEVVVPEQEITGKTEHGVKQVEQPGTYYLQVGSFRNSDQADSFKAELALLGLETSIQKVTIDNNTTWHRVRVGPYTDLDALNKARHLLSQRHIDSTLVRLKP
jgi:cell division protein FtsN